MRSPKPAPQYLLTAEVLELERQDASAFQPLPFHYIEVAHFLLQEGVHEMLAREVFGDEAQATEVRQGPGGIAFVTGRVACELGWWLSRH